MSIEKNLRFDVNIQSSKKTSYPIYIGENILKSAGNIVKENVSSSKILLVSNDTIYPIYGKKVKESLEKAGLNIKTVVIPDGEDYKNINWFKVIIDKAVEFQLERKDCIVALGGGVIGDMAGYAASSYLRGINLVHIATTLLSQVDSSIGGKVGINHQRGKNLIGAFYQPSCVIIDPLSLHTLDIRNIKTGLAEVLKYALIEKNCNQNLDDRSLLKFLVENCDPIYNLNSEVIAKTILYCCKLKAMVVEKDEKESGLRTVLNLGHTLGHALETASEYTLLTHGEAVSIGIIAATRLAVDKGLITDSIANVYESLIKQYSLMNKIPNNIDKQRILNSMKLDKKVLSGKIRFVLPSNELGFVNIYDDIDESQILQVIETLY